MRKHSAKGKSDMDPLTLISELDEPALEELVILFRRMADDAADLRVHATLPASVTMLDNRRRTLIGLAEMVEALVETQN